jgi:beta-N-acetylglucosaminidase
MKKVLMYLIVILSILILSDVKASTYTYRIKVLNNQTNLRNNPGGTDNSRLGLLSKNDYYVLKDDKLYPDENNHNNCKGDWYYMTYYTGLDGYVCSDDVELIVSYSTDDVEPATECEKALSEAGFPSSYWGGLCSLKEKHPSWNFQPIKIDMDWSYVVERESECTKNYIYKGVYDKTFLDETCTATSPGGYVAPSQTGVAYYMDPRNSFTEKYLFQFLDQSYDKLLEQNYPSAVETILSGAEFNNYHLNLGNNLKDIIIGGSIDKASPIAIASKIRIELGVGTSLENLYKGVYDGYDNMYLDYYNFFNFGVTDNCVATSGATYCGLNYAYKFGWKGVDAAIKGGINQFSGGYILKDQYTGYFQKFNVATKTEGALFGHQYMTNLAGAMSESGTAYNAYNKNNLLELNLTFKIPIFNKMDATIINSGNGAVDDGNDKPAPSTIPISTIVTSSGYRYTSKYISNIAVGTDVSTTKVTLESVGGNATVSILDASGNVKTSGIIATGDKITINNEENTETLEVVIKGDTSGDGVINALDLLQVQKNILGTYTLTGAYLEAADTSKDGMVNALDLLQIQKSILGTYEIEQ